MPLNNVSALFCREHESRSMDIKKNTNTSCQHPADAKHVPAPYPHTFLLYSVHVAV